MEKELFTKSILTKKEQNEKRVSVMSRHTKNDGVTPDERIVKGESFDEWRKEFGPPPILVGAYYRGELSWDDFEKKYIKFLQTPEIKPKVESFAKRCIEETITLLCIEDTADRCHRRLLAEELKKYQPQLKISHK